MEVLSLILCGVALVLVLIEVFLPGIMIGLLGGAMLLGGIVVGFQADTTLGMGEVVTSAVIVPLLVWWALRRIELKEQLDPPAPGEDLSTLLGKGGRVVTDLRPSGTIRIEGKKYTANTFGEYVEAGRAITVVKVEGKRIFVRAE